jgi:hypothetical protein
VTGLEKLQRFLDAHEIESHSYEGTVPRPGRLRYSAPIEPALVVAAHAQYESRPAEIRVWFSMTGAFRRWEIKVPGCTFKGFPRTLKCLIEDDGYGEPLLIDMSPRAARERRERERQRQEDQIAERRRRAESLREEATAECERTLVDMGKLVRQQVPSLTEQAADNILLAILGSDHNDPLSPLMRFIASRDHLNEALRTLGGGGLAVR